MTKNIKKLLINSDNDQYELIVPDTYSKSEIEAAIANKVDKVSGKGLSTNDYTTEEKNKLAGAYTKPSGGIPKTDLDSTVQTSLENADLYTADDVKAKLLTVDGSGSKIDADLLDGVELQNILERKYSGGQYQRGAGWKRIAETLDNDSVGSCFRLFLYTSYNDAANEAYIFDISIAYNGTICIEQHAGTAKPASVTRVIDKIRVDYRPSQVAYIDVHHSIAGGNGLWWTTEGAAKSYKTVQEAELLGTAYEFTTTAGCKTDRGFYGSFHGNADSATKATQDGSGNVITTTYATKTELNEKVDKVSGKGLSTNDYTTEEKNKLAGAYTKPSGGIPKTDLASAVQTSLGKADTALQSFTETDPTVPAWAKAANKPTYTAAEVGALPSTTTIPTKVSQLTNDSGFVLPSGLKSINGESIVGSGNIVLPTNITETDPVFTASPAYSITADRMNEWDNKMSEIPVVSHGNGDTTFELTPNILHIWNEVSSLNLTLAVNTTPKVYTEYMFQFSSGATATTLILPSNVIFPKQPEILANKTYQVSILNNLAVIVSF